MSAFTEAELAYLQGTASTDLDAERRLARLATIGPDGTPHVCPVGMWNLEGRDTQRETITISGWDFANTKKFRDVARTGRAAIVVDDLADAEDSWRPRGIEVRGRAEAVEAPEAHIRLHPERIVGWGLDHPGQRNARTVPTVHE
ncbi:MAG TPA: PPOX class F420-dependent oxidoreductase [Jiangellaceae bacterium]|nr:PPOX class F420-dependent oxidoreductase [Jiangellaceae bacterium]